MTPIPVLPFGVAPAAAMGADLWTEALTKLVGGAVHQAQGSVDGHVQHRLLTGSLPASVLSQLWLHIADVPQLGHGPRLGALGAVILLTAMATMLRGHLCGIGNALSMCARQLGTSIVRTIL